MRNAAINFIKGILVGVANIIPGVSGGTIAVVLGIFDPLIEAAGGFYKDLKRHSLFLLPILAGMAAGIVAFSSLLEYALAKYSFPTCMFFVGLVAGSVPLIYRKATERPYRNTYMLATLAAALAVIAFALLRTPDPFDARTAVDGRLMLNMFLGGAVASAAMVIPGISGSFVMVLLGLYPVVIKYVSSIKDFLLSPTDFALFFEIVRVLAPLAVGVAIGIVAIAKIIGFLMKKAYSITYFTILGLVLGSVFGLFKDPIAYQSGVTAVDIAAGAVLLAVGAVLALRLGRE